MKYPLNTLLFLLVFVGCVNQHANNELTDAIHIRNKYGLRRTNFSNSSQSGYTGHYFRSDLFMLTQRMSLQQQSYFMLDCLDKDQAYDFDGELAYEFYAFFENPFTFKKVCKTALEITHKDYRYNRLAKNNKLIKWLEREAE